MKGQIASLHLQIRTYVFVNGPGEFVIQLPRNHCHQHRDQSNDTWNRNQERFFLVPDRCIDMVRGAKLCDGFIDLIHLHSGVDQKANIVDAQPYDLDGIL